MLAGWSLGWRRLDSSRAKRQLVDGSTATSHPRMAAGRRGKARQGQSSPHDVQQAWKPARHLPGQVAYDAAMQPRTDVARVR
jgi:hypothetical protein